jgi:coenzyme Q-binding protein COQ10
MATYSEIRVIPYTPDQVFDLVADVERYPEFLPWWRAARITGTAGDGYETDQVIGFGVLRLPFHSRTVLERPRHIVVTSSGGPVRRLAIDWSFERAPHGGCRTRVVLDLELRSKLVEGVLATVFRDAVRRAVSTFEGRARALYGPPSHRERRPRRGPRGAAMRARSGRTS